MVDLPQVKRLVIDQKPVGPLGFGFLLLAGQDVDDSGKVQTSVSTNLSAAQREGREMLLAAAIAFSIGESDFRSQVLHIGHVLQKSEIILGLGVMKDY